MSQRRNPHRLPSSGRLARPSRGLLAVLMIAVTLVLVGELAHPSPASAAPLPCGSGAIYGIGFTAGGSSPRKLVSIDTATAAATDLVTLPAGGTALGSTQGGTAIYYVTNPGASTVNIVKYDPILDLFTSYFAPLTMPKGGPVNGGGVDRSSGIFYFTHPNSALTAVDIYAFDTNTNTFIGYVGKVVPSAGVPPQNADIEFDQSGNMLIVIGSDTSSQASELRRVPSPPTTVQPPSTVLPSTVLTQWFTPSRNLGIAFADDGYLYISTPNTLAQVDPNTGVIGPNIAYAQNVDIDDLSNCSGPGSISLRKNLPDRVNSGDQFSLSITPAGGGNTATTSGSATGVQAAVAGPIIGVPGTTYTVSESAAGTTTLSDYIPSLECIDLVHGNATIATTQVTPTSHTFVFPAASGGVLANIECTFTNDIDTPPAPGLSVLKQAGTPVDVNGSGLVDAGDTIAYTFTVTNIGNVPVTGITVSDPRAGAVTCVDTDLAVGESTACAADDLYVITIADEAAGSVDNVAVGTGTDPDGDPVVTPPTGGSTSTPTVRPVVAVALSKGVIGAPVSNGDGTWTITYQLVTRNTGNAPGSYDLTDELNFGTGISVVSAVATNTVPGTVALNGDWDGSSDTDVATGVSIAAGARHEYRVVVVAGVAPDLTRDSTDCVLDPDEPGTGFLNEASVTVPSGGQGSAVRQIRAVKSDPVSACAPVGLVTVEKELVETRYAATGGGVTAVYVLTASNVGSGPADYVLTDKLLWTPGIEIRSARVTAVPDGETASTTWNGVTDTVISDDASLEAGDSEVWEVTVEGIVPSTLTASERDCTLTSAEEGTGLLNTASVDDDGTTVGDEACEVRDCRA